MATSTSRKFVVALYGYAAAAGAAVLGAVLRLAVDPIAGDFYTFTFFYAVVPLIAWRYGLGSALFALGFSALIAVYVLVEPRGALSAPPHVLLGLGLFVIIGLGLAFLGDSIRRSRERLQSKAVELEREVVERRATEADVARLNALLKERVEELKIVINSSPIAMGVATDADCSHIWGNQALVDLLGVAPGENISKSSSSGVKLPFKVYLQGQEAITSDLPMQYCTRHGVDVRDAEIEIVRDDGRRLTLLGNAVPLQHADGTVRGCIGAFVDITERKSAEHEREEANQRKDEFLATLAHELRNPLAPLAGAAAIIKRQHQDDKKLQWAGGVIERQVDHMTRLVDDLLDVARITRGLVTLKQESVDLRVIVWQAVELARPLLEQRKHQLRVELPMQPLPLRVDRVRLIQVIVNILSNAAKYTPEQGSVLITAKEDRGSVILKIRDNGIGIPTELLPRVFDAFVHGARSLARTEGGLGLGLTLVKKIVELHEGTVTITSGGIGQGTEVLITLPCAEHAVAPEAAQTAPTHATRRKVLLVDDNADVADTLGALLRLSGHDVRVAYNAEASLTLAAGFQPDVAFLDIGLPDLDGYELARRFRADPVLKNVRLVALTGYGRADDRARSAAAGFDWHLTKPYNPEQLAKVLEKLAESRDDHPPRTTPSGAAEYHVGT